MKRNQPIQKIDLGKDVLLFDYSETIFLIGRSKECHVFLDDKQISREHIRLIHKNGKWSCEKVAPDNACLCNGEEFSRIELYDGDVLTVGSYTINIENSSEANSTISLIVKDVPTIEIPTPVLIEDQIQDEIIEDIENKNEKKRLLQDDVTAEIHIPSDFESLNEPSIIQNNEFNFEENNESIAEAVLEMNSDLAVDNQKEMNSLIENDDNMAYSLENIDNEDESTKVIQSFSKVLLELFGETAPYDKYLIENDKTYIGRDPSKCQIVLNDSEVSSVHAVITKDNIMITIEDLNSSNGTILNGDRINKASLNHNDEFLIGGVSFSVKVRSDFLKEESSSLMSVDENQTIEIEEIVEVQAEEGENVDALGEMLSDAPVEKSLLKRIWKDEEKRKKAIYLTVVLVGAWVLFGDDSSIKQPISSKKSNKEVVKSAPVDNKNSGKKLSDDEKRSLSSRYEIGKNHYFNGRYREALDEFQKIAAIDSNFNSSLQSLIALSKEGLSKLEEQEKKRLAEQLAVEKKLKLKDLMDKAHEYVKDRRVELANDTFNEIAKIDPENIEITKLKFELEDWQKEKSRKELAEANNKKIREDKVEKLKDGKKLFIQKEWFKAIGKLDDFLKIKEMDEDLSKEASEMLKTSRDEISNSVAPLLGKAKSLMEGQDLKGAYEVYQQILKIEPSNPEALNATGDIKDQLMNKARKIYREAIISESLSLFQDAKEKFQEVQQVSPVDSNYYKKATDKLKDYLE